MTSGTLHVFATPEKKGDKVHRPHDSIGLLRWRSAGGLRRSVGMDGGHGSYLAQN